MKTVCVLDNLSVTGLDFHTVPDSVAPHSDRHPHWLPHPSRWSIDLLLVAFSPLPGNAFHFLLSGGVRFEPSAMEVIVVVEVNCVSLYFPPSAFSFQMNHQYLLLRESTHVDYPVAFSFSVCGEWHLNDGWIPGFSPGSVCVCVTCFCLCYTETPSILGGHNQHLEIGLECPTASPKLELMIIPLVPDKSLLGLCHENPKCWEVTVWACGCHLGAA